MRTRVHGWRGACRVGRRGRSRSRTDTGVERGVTGRSNLLNVLRFWADGARIRGAEACRMWFDNESVSIRAARQQQQAIWDDKASICVCDAGADSLCSSDAPTSVK